MTEPTTSLRAVPRVMPHDRVVELEKMGYSADNYRFQPMDATRRVIARRMTESFRDVPHFSLFSEIELDALVRTHNAFKETLTNGGARPTLNDVFIKAAALALAAEPAANVSFMPEGLLFHTRVHIAFAVSFDGGLVTPVVRDADTKALIQIAAETADLAKRARIRRLQPDEYAGGTFTISNLGMFGVRSFTSVLNAPQACILSIGAAEPRPSFRQTELRRVLAMDVSLTCDHRSMDGAVGARLLSAFKTLLQEPTSWIS